jgi:hypothetical protein
MFCGFRTSAACSPKMAEKKASKTDHRNCGYRSLNAIYAWYDQNPNGPIESVWFSMDLPIIKKNKWQVSESRITSSNQCGSVLEDDDQQGLV